MILKGALFTLKVELTGEPCGRYLGTLDLPGPTIRYLNIGLWILGFRALLGYVLLK